MLAAMFPDPEEARQPQVRSQHEPPTAHMFKGCLKH